MVKFMKMLNLQSILFISFTCFLLSCIEEKKFSEIDTIMSLKENEMLSNDLETIIQKLNIDINSKHFSISMGCLDIDTIKSNKYYDFNVFYQKDSITQYNLLIRTNKLPALYYYDLNTEKMYKFIKKDKPIFVSCKSGNYSRYFGKTATKY